MTYVFELTDEELTAVSGTGSGAYDLGGVGLAGAGIDGLGIGMPALGIGVPALGIDGFAGLGGLGVTGPYIHAHTNSANSSIAYNHSLKQSNASGNTAFTMIN